MCGVWMSVDECVCVYVCVCVCVCVCPTYTLVVLHLITRGADAAEGPVQVLAGSGRAGTRQARTLVDI